MDRREFFSPLTSSIKSGISSPKHIDQISATKKVNRGLSKGITPYIGAWTYDQVAHLLRRTMFGATIDDIKYFLGKNMDAAVDELLNPTAALPSPPINAYNTAQAIDPNVIAGLTWVNASDDPNFNPQRRLSLKTWWMGVMINQDRSIREKMVMFWHNHFSTEINTYDSPMLAYRHNNLLRINSLGNFKSFVKDITKDGAMLVYLNGNVNTKAAPDENYARELQELFTVGKDLNPHYSEDDVKNAAKVLTGWRINNQRQVSFDVSKHDTTNKTFSSFYNNTTITGQSSANAGDLELDSLLNMIFAQDEVARYICRKLYRYFVYYDIDAATEQNVIVPLANIFRQNNYGILPVLSALFKSEHFFDAANMGCLIKPPTDFVVSMCRTTYLKFPDPGTQYDILYKHWADLYIFNYAIGQDIGDPPNVAGWPAYYQIPSYHELWINSDSLPKRNQITDYYVAVGNKKGNFTVIMDLIELSKKMTKPDDPNILIDDLCKYLHASLSLSATTKLTTKISTLLSGQAQDYYWTNAWNDHINNPNDATKKQIVTLRLMLLYRYLLDLSEYQLS